MDDTNRLKLLRELAKRTLPQYNPEEWTLDRKDENKIYVASTLDEPIFAKINFEINTDLKLSYDGLINVPDHYRSNGLGSKLVGIREKFCQELGIEKIIINENENPSFWSNKGFRFMMPDEINQHDFLNYAYHEPMIKYLDKLTDSIKNTESIYSFKEKKEAYSPKGCLTTKIEPEDYGVFLIN